jgi:hypothetical protein
MRWADKTVQANNKNNRQPKYSAWMLNSVLTRGFHKTLKRAANKPARSNASNRQLYAMMASLTQTRQPP